MLSGNDRIIKKLFEVLKDKESSQEQKDKYLNVKDLPNYEVSIEEWDKVRGFIESRGLVIYETNKDGTFLRYSPHTEEHLKYLEKLEREEKEYFIKEKELSLQERQTKILEEQINIQKEQQKIQAEQTKIQHEQQKSQKYQTAAMWSQVIVAITLVFITAILGISNLKLLYYELDITSKSVIPNKAELRIIPTDNYFFNRTRLFDGSHDIILNVENRGRISSGRVFLSLGTELIYNLYPYTINDIPEKNKTALRIKIIPSCYGKEICNEKNVTVPLGVYKLPVYVHCDSCEPINYQDIINLCIFGGNYPYERCNKEYPK